MIDLFDVDHRTAFTACTETHGAKTQGHKTGAVAKWPDGKTLSVTFDETGHINELSKTVRGGLGEAVGINFVSSRDKAALVRQLQRVDAQDYFERGIELAIEHDGVRFQPVDISDLYAVEIDFAEDLERANLFV